MDELKRAVEWADSELFTLNSYMEGKYIFLCVLWLTCGLSAVKEHSLINIVFIVACYFVTKIILKV